MSYQTVLLERDAKIATLTINRPAAANTIDAQLMLDMNAALDELEKDVAIRVIVLTGAGERHFCGGADLRALGQRSPGSPPVNRSRDFISHLETVAQPVIAAINGAAMGGGCEIAIACDFRIMAEEARIGVPEIQFGALPAGGGTQRLPRIVGLARAKDLVLTGRHLQAREALEIGLVHRVVPRAALKAASLELAGELAQRARYALVTGKRLLNQALDLTIAQGLVEERREIARMASVEEMREAREEAMARSPTYSRIFKG